MKIQQKLVFSYFISLIITILLGILDSDPIINFTNFIKDVLIISCILWTLTTLIYLAIIYIFNKFKMLKK